MPATWKGWSVADMKSIRLVQGIEEEPRPDKKPYEAELTRLQAELVEMQEWVRTSGQRLVVVF